MASDSSYARALIFRRCLLHYLRAIVPYLWLMMFNKVVVYYSIWIRRWSLSPKIMIRGYSSKYYPSNRIFFHQWSNSNNSLSIYCYFCDFRISSKICCLASDKLFCIMSARVNSFTGTITWYYLLNICLIYLKSESLKHSLWRSSTR